MLTVVINSYYFNHIDWFVLQQKKVSPDNFNASSHRLPSSGSAQPPPQLQQQPPPPPSLSKHDALTIFLNQKSSQKAPHGDLNYNSQPGWYSNHQFMTSNRSIKRNLCSLSQFLSKFWFSKVKIVHFFFFLEFWLKYWFFNVKICRYFGFSGRYCSVFG